MWIVLIVVVLIAWLIFKAKAMNKKDGETQTRICPYCKKPIPLDASKCPYCLEKSADYRRTRSGDKLIYIVAGVILAIILIFALGVEALKSLGVNI